MLTPPRSRTQSAKRTLLRILASANARDEGRVLDVLAQRRQPVEVDRASRGPMRASISADRSRLALASQRRGVTPLVMLQNRSGKIRAKSAKIVSHDQLAVQLRDAVDLVAGDHAQVGHAHPALAGLVDQRHAGAAGPRRCRSARARSSRKRRLISKMISMWRGRTLRIMPTGQVSSASGISVWLV